MKKRMFWLALLPALCAAASAGTFDYVIQTTTASQTFSVLINGAVGISIDWGDGASASGLSGNGVRSHVYAAAGVYTNKVAGTATHIAFGGDGGTTPALLRDIVSRMSDGVTGINNAYKMFNSANNITNFTQADWFDAASANVVNMGEMFQGASKFNQSLNGWNVGNVTTMNRLFNGAAAFNGDVGSWDVGKVTTMELMFNNAAAFNQDIGGWNVGGVTTMASMFNGASKFNQDIGGWDVGKVTSMASMLRGTA